MKTDSAKTKVQFLVNETDGKDLFAFFPEEKDHEEYFKCYSIIGKHSSCGVIYATESRPATPEEYAPLKTELEGLGYNLEIVN